MDKAPIGTPEQLRDPDYTPPLAQAIPLGIQHVLAMFISNVTPAIIIAGVAGFGFGSNSPHFPNLIYMIQMSMLFAGIATLFQTIGFGPVGARLPIVQGTSFDFSLAAVIGFCLMAIISAIDTVGDVSGITKGGAGREASDVEIKGATFADGLGTALAGIFGGLPNTSFSQNVGLVAMTGVMSRRVVTSGAVFLIGCGLIPKFGAIISTVPIEVLGGGVIVMFGMVVAAGVSMLADVDWSRRNMVIFAISLSLGLGLQLEPGALQHLPATAKVLLSSGLLPAAALAIVLNLAIP